MSRSPAYDLRKGTFREGWYDFIPRVLAQKRVRETPCQHCDLISLCGQCPGWAQMESGDQEEPVAYLCQIAHRRAEAFGLNQSEQERKIEEESGNKDKQGGLLQAAIERGAVNS